MQRSINLTEGPIVKSLVALSVPIVLSNLLQSAYQITDTFWVGRLSTQAVAAVSLSFPISFLLIALGGGLPMAGTVLAAQYKGKGDTDALNHTAAQTFLMVLVISVVLTVFGYVFSQPIMVFMGAAPDVLPDATRFMRTTFLGFLFVFSYFTFESLMRGLGQVRVPLFIVLCTVILNFFLDPLFIFGYGPIPAMGVSGAAMATLCTQALATIIGFSVLLSGNYGVSISLKNLRPDFAFLRLAFRIGFPSSIEQSTHALGMTVMTLLAASFGTVAVAAYGIGIRMLIIVIIPALGLSIATSIFVGQNIGARKIDRAAQATRIGMRLGFCILTLLGFMMFIIALPMTVFFVPLGGEAIDLAVTFIRVIALSFGFISLQMVINGTFRGAGQTHVAMIMTLVFQWVLQFPIAYVLSKHTSLGFYGICWSFAITNVIAAWISMVWYVRGDWKKTNLLDELEMKVRNELVTEEGVGT